MKNKLIIVLLIITGFWTFQTIGHKTDKPCINVYVDYGSLDSNKKVIGCINADHRTNAQLVFDRAGFKLEGTQKYGLQVVCRVDGLPTPKQEKCETMPPENAYWALIVKQNTSAVSMAMKWGWAQTGLEDLYLNPGDSVGLVFSKGNKIVWPD